MDRSFLFSYLVGQAIAGFIFNEFGSNPVFGYWDVHCIGSEADHLKFIARFKQAASRLTGGEGLQSQREQLVVLSHVTGSGSGAAFISLLILIAYCIPKQNRWSNIWPLLFACFALGL